MSDFLQTSDLQELCQLSRECITVHLYGNQLELILAGLALLQQRAGEQQQDNHLQLTAATTESRSFSPTEIESLRGEIYDSIAVYRQSPEFLWKQTVVGILQTDADIDANSPLAELISHLDYAVDKDNLSPEQALEVLAGERSWLLEIDRQELREEVLAAFDE